MSLPKRAAVLVALAAFGVFALQGFSGAATAGKYAGTNSEKGTVSFTVSAGGATVVSFSTTDDYNRGCHYRGGAGGFPALKVQIASMVISKTGVFTVLAHVKKTPFPGTAPVEVTGTITGSHATGTVTWVGDTCGSGSSNPSTQAYLESFTASRA